MSFLNKHIFFRLLLSYIITLVVVMVVLVAGVYVFSPNAYQRHMLDGVIDPTMPMMNSDKGYDGQNSGQGYRLMEGRSGENGVPQAGTAYLNFRGAMFDSLLWAIIAAVIVAVGISIYNSRKILQPLQHMDEASREIANGNYAKRIPVEGQDEFSHLARSFNAMSEKLEGIENTRIQMIGDISHELRTPLTILHGYLEGMADGLIPAENDTFALMQRETARLTRLVNGLQELSRVESGSVNLELMKVDLSSWMGELIKKNELLFEENSLKLDLYVSAPAEGVMVNIDDDRMTQIMTNLLSNARQFSPADGTIKVSMDVVDERMEIRISDNGIGISPENLPHIFERFYQVERSRSNNQRGGSGIGLSIVHALVVAHGGDIQVESAGLNKGTTFIIHLPTLN